MFDQSQYKLRKLEVLSLISLFVISGLGYTSGPRCGTTFKITSPDGGMVDTLA